MGDSTLSLVALQRWAGQRRVSLDGWRRHLETAAGARARPSQGALRSHRVGDRCELRARLRAHRRQGSGWTWDLVNGSHSLFQRAWYYMHVIADPLDPNTVYVLDVEFLKSTDGGRNFNKVKVPHGDNHGLWIEIGRASGR